LLRSQPFISHAISGMQILYEGPSRIELLLLALDESGAQQAKFRTKSIHYCIYLKLEEIHMQQELYADSCAAHQLSHVLSIIHEQQHASINFVQSSFCLQVCIWDSCMWAL
jgi:hypothetical protein